MRGPHDGPLRWFLADMTPISFERLLRSSRLALPTPRIDAFIVDRSIRVTRPDRDLLEGKHQRGSSPRAGGNNGGALKTLTNKLGARLRQHSHRQRSATSSPWHDGRQHVIAKIHYFGHSGGGAAALKAHGRYIARDATSERKVAETPDKTDTQPRDRAQSDYLERGGRGAFYDMAGSAPDGAARLESWAKSDLRHFRIILSAEEGARLRDLSAYTREVMARAGAGLGTELSWIAVDHRDTDNPHTHIVVRGRRANGQDLIIPRDFVKHGFRGIARDVATEWLGDRTLEQERRSYERQIRRHGLTKLDGVIDLCAQRQTVDLNRLEAPNGDPYLTQAAKARVQELARMGLAQRERAGLFRLAADWSEKLKAMDLHLDKRRQVIRERIERNTARQLPDRSVRKGLLDR